MCIRDSYYELAILAVLCSVITAFVYLRVAVLMYMKEPVQTASPDPDDAQSSHFPLAVSAALAVAALVTLIGGILPGILTSWAAAP